MVRIIAIKYLSGNRVTALSTDLVTETTTEVGATGDGNATVGYATHKYISGLTSGDTISSVTLDLYNASTNIKVGVYTTTGSGSGTKPDSLLAQGVGAVSVSNTYTTVTIPLTTTCTVPSNGIVWVGMFPEANVNIRQTTETGAYTNSKHGSGVSGASYANAMPSTAWVGTGGDGGNGGYNVRFGVVISTPKLGTTDATATYPTSGVLPTGSTTTDWTLTDTTISNSALNFDSAQASTQNDGVYDLGSALSNTKWVVRFKYTIANLTNGNQSNINAYLGLFSGTGSFATNQNYMGLSYYTTSSTNYFWASASPSSNSTIWESSSTGRIYDGSVSATTYYVEIKRTSASTGEISIGTNSDFVTGRTTQTTFYGSISSSITGLRYIGIKNRSNVPTLGSAVFNGTVSDIEVYDGITAITTDSAVTVPNGSVVEETNTGKHKIWNSTTSAWVEIS